MTELSIVIPCYNEDDNIFPLFSKIENLLRLDDKIEIIIVDNGSTDKTNQNILKSDLFIANKIKLTKIDNNIGYGFGIMSGVKIAKGDYIGWCHADLQTEPSDVYNAFSDNKNKLATGKYVIKGLRKNRNIFDDIFTFGMSLIASTVFLKKINDINAQPKLFPKSFLTYLENHPNDFSLDLFFLVIAKNNGFKIINHDVTMKKRLHGEAKGGGSLKGKIKLIKRTLLYIIELRKKLWNS